MEFTGFPSGALTFLEELEANNDRGWFKANRPRYDELLVAPAEALGEALADFGATRRFRPYNDARFHARPPIKEQLGVRLGYETSGGFYFELSLDGLFVAAGMYRTSPDQVARLREAVAVSRRADELRAALDTAREGHLSVSEPDLKRVPRGWDADHPAAELLRHRTLTVSVRNPLAPWVHTKTCATRVRAQLESARPTVDWLRAYVGPPSGP